MDRYRRFRWEWKPREMLAFSKPFISFVNMRAKHFFCQDCMHRQEVQPYCTYCFENRKPSWIKNMRSPRASNLGCKSNPVIISKQCISIVLEKLSEQLVFWVYEEKISRILELVSFIAFLIKPHWSLFIWVVISASNSVIIILTNVLWSLSTGIWQIIINSTPSLNEMNLSCAWIN